jgi:hypothetical protein
MLTFMQLKVMKANRVPLTQAQKAQIPDIEVAKRFVRQAIRESLAANGGGISGGLAKGELDRIFNNQPVYFDDTGYVAHWFARLLIKRWVWEISAESDSATVRHVRY